MHLPLDAPPSPGSFWKILDCLSGWHKAIIHVIPMQKGKVVDPLSYKGLALGPLYTYHLRLHVRQCQFYHCVNGDRPFDRQNGFFL